MRLPAWVAEVDLDGERAGLRLVSGETDCEIHRFGRGAASVALFEGYLYERRALERELAGAGEPPSTAALLASAYERWGAGLFDRLDGSFAALVWDAESRRLIAGHDAFGHHPLFYRSSPRRDSLWLATNVLALAHCGRFRVAPHRLNLALNLRLARPTPGETYFEGIERLAPGHRLEAEGGAEPRRIRHWNPVPEPGEEDLAPKVVLAELEDRLMESVERSMELGPDGVMLSGGLDSVCIAALAADYTRAHELPPLIAYSARHHPDDPPTYEEEMQDLVAARLGMPQCLSNERDWLGSRPLIEASLDEVRRFPCPSTIFWKGGYMGFARWAAARGDHRFLTGSGGDEWLTVDPRYAADLLRRGALFRLASFVRADYSGTGTRLSRVLEYLLWTWGARLLLGDVLRRLCPGPLHRRLERRVRAEIGDECTDEQLRRRMVEVGLERRIRALGLRRRGG
ncbi:MAG: asparagine synthase-related protein, partial [Thermoanaerobaculia bacterium]|nr:asparagine synthase-related protein [Thermoanaerobaculia bacterium]